MSETKCVETSPVERFIILPPYVVPEHRDILQKAYDSLEEYEKHLIDILKKKVFEHGWNINPHPDDVREIERMYHEDPVRQMLLRNLSNVKLLVERPRFEIKEI